LEENNAFVMTKSVAKLRAELVADGLAGGVEGANKLNGKEQEQMQMREEAATEEQAAAPAETARGVFQTRGNGTAAGEGRLAEEPYGKGGGMGKKYAKGKKGDKGAKQTAAAPRAAVINYTSRLNARIEKDLANGDDAASSDASSEFEDPINEEQFVLDSDTSEQVKSSTGAEENENVKDAVDSSPLGNGIAVSPSTSKPLNERADEDMKDIVRALDAFSSTPENCAKETRNQRSRMLKKRQTNEPSGATKPKELPGTHHTEEFLQVPRTPGDVDALLAFIEGDDFVVTQSKKTKKKYKVKGKANPFVDESTPDVASSDDEDPMVRMVRAKQKAADARMPGPPKPSSILQSAPAHILASLKAAEAGGGAGGSSSNSSSSSGGGAPPPPPGSTTVPGTHHTEDYLQAPRLPGDEDALESSIENERSAKKKRNQRSRMQKKRQAKVTAPAAKPEELPRTYHTEESLQAPRTPGDKDALESSTEHGSNAKTKRNLRSRMQKKRQVSASAAAARSEELPGTHQSK
jgi:hypothetical protein